MEIKDCNVMIDGQIFFKEPAKDYLRTNDNIRKFAAGQGDDYTTGFLLDYNCFNKYYKKVAIE